MYACIFFDLDHTLWDFEANSNETLSELYDTFKLYNVGITDLTTFQQHFKRINTQLWALYDNGVIDAQIIRQQRFQQILACYDIVDVTLTQKLSENYLALCPSKGHLIPGAIETLEYLKPNYKMSIVTNGFEEIQNIKLKSSNLHHYFDHIVTSQQAGCKKPAQGIFDFALLSHSIKCHEAIMVGDNLVTDIGGARNASIDTVFFNPEGTQHDETIRYEIKELRELTNIL